MSWKKITYYKESGIGMDLAIEMLGGGGVAALGYGAHKAIQAIRGRNKDTQPEAPQPHDETSGVLDAMSRSRQLIDAHQGHHPDIQIGDESCGGCGQKLNWGNWD